MADCELEGTVGEGHGLGENVGGEEIGGGSDSRMAHAGALGAVERAGRCDGSLENGREEGARKGGSGVAAGEAVEEGEEVESRSGWIGEEGWNGDEGRVWVKRVGGWGKRRGRSDEVEGGMDAPEKGGRRRGVRGVGGNNVA